MLSLQKYGITGFDGEASNAEISCYPNPFSKEITIEINLPEDAQVTVEVMNQLGQRIKYLETGNLLNKGTHRLIWNGTYANNRHVAPGIYHLKVGIGDELIHRKIVMSN